MSKKVIQTVAVDNVGKLVDMLTSLALDVPTSTIYVEGPSGGSVKLSLIEETLSDQSIVYSIVISEVKA